MTITASHNMTQLHARQHCPCCNHTSDREGSNEHESVPVYCVPACVRDVTHEDEGYYRPRQ